ncbi:hypothetical protein [Mucilaginibacter aquatilis]|uniref:TerB family tellurite resistance protein n=1 Tax=Mucilaginibacter aquatilis TaxID=1517760 RepID=A0A6I4I8Z3_9SPHI|nr:hypothetical protein [Mucilaginibacter aquatilis]MVN91512.1 hypothetical protein [Mucilaginibacter aquatilis]
MAYVRLVLIALMFSTSAKAQNFSEWFRQKKTQKKYLLQQIAALQVYGGYLHKGYQIAQGGLGSIGGYIGHELLLHKDYYDRLKTASPSVKSNPQIKQIMRWQQDILFVTRAINKQGGLNESEATYAAQVTEKLLNDCDAQLHDLETVLAANKVAMNDEERLRQTGKIYEAMESNFRFVTSFQAQLGWYAYSKNKEQLDVKRLRKLYENH